MPIYRHEPTRVYAHQLDANVKVMSSEGMLEGKPGDYLVIGIQGEPWIVKESVFKASYQLSGDEN